MKLLKSEKIWLASVLFFYIAYNLPFIPAYGNSKATIIHAFLTLVPLWISIYAGFAVICRQISIRPVTPNDSETIASQDKENLSC